MSSDIMAAQMSTKGITFSRAQTGWIFREDRRVCFTFIFSINNIFSRFNNVIIIKEMVGPFNADFYQINGMILASRKRREHLSEEDLQKNKAIMELLTKGSSQRLKGVIKKIYFLFMDHCYILPKKKAKKMLSKYYLFSASS